MMKQYLIKIFCCVILSLLLVPAFGLAQQEEQKPEEFFNKNSVTNGVFPQIPRKSSPPIRTSGQQKGDTFVIEAPVSTNPPTENPQPKSPPPPPPPTPSQTVQKDPEVDKLHERSLEIQKRLGTINKGTASGQKDYRYYESVLKALEKATGESADSDKKKTILTGSELNDDVIVLAQAFDRKPDNKRNSLFDKKLSEGFVPPDTISLVISGKDEDHLEKHLKKLSWIGKTLHVKVGNVLIVGGLNNMENWGEVEEKIGYYKMLQEKLGKKTFADPEKKSELAMMYHRHKKYMALLGLVDYELILSQKVIKRLNLTYSPTWIVRHLGRDYIFEGFENPEKLFNRKGEFRRADF